MMTTVARSCRVLVECFENMLDVCVRYKFFSVLHINDCIVQLHCNVIYFQYVFNAAGQ